MEAHESQLPTTPLGDVYATALQASQRATAQSRLPVVFGHTHAPNLATWQTLMHWFPLAKRLLEYPVLLRLGTKRWPAIG